MQSYRKSQRIAANKATNVIKFNARDAQTKAKRPWCLNPSIEIQFTTKSHASMGSTTNGSEIENTGKCVSISANPVINFDSLWQGAAKSEPIS